MGLSSSPDYSLGNSGRLVCNGVRHATPSQDRIGGELGPVVANDHFRLAAPGDNIGQFTRHAATRDRRIGDRISKRSNSHPRRLFIHGARSVAMHSDRKRGIGLWLTGLEQRAQKNVAVVVLADKIVRISWAVLARGEDYRVTALATA